ncbi:SAVED domain-containing protein [Ruminococcaceae bacterium OttesenSCG-928-A16]|nr:SAVED domain-containing protein [Ruminococcaceae bacterium OttesenSCG-928-A16]
MNQPKYVNWFAEESAVTLEDGTPISCYRLDYSMDEIAYCEWALHLRQHYESDDELKESLDTTGLPVEEYLRTHVIPQKDDTLGPTSRSNDFTEIMICDLLEFIHGYTVPRCKQRNRSGKTQSEHGTDVLAYKYVDSIKAPNSKDELLAVEVKAGLSSDKYDPIGAAVADSHKYDEVRHAFTLNYYRKKLRHINNEQADEIARFQQKSEHDYIITFVAAAIISRDKIANDIVLGIKGDDLELRKDNKIFLVHGKKLMDLAHEIFERCVK